MKTEYYKGYSITLGLGFYWAVGFPYETIEAAKETIDSILD